MKHFTASKQKISFYDKTFQRIKIPKSENGYIFKLKEDALFELADRIGYIEAN
jgi:hypothetical protein